MSRRSEPIQCTDEQLRQLHEIADDANNPRLADRARMVLACLDTDALIMNIAAELHERPNTVIFWKRRFAEHGIDGLYNLPRGRQRTIYGEPFRQQLLATISLPPPDGSPRWTGKLLAEHLDVPPQVIWRYLRKKGKQLKGTLERSGGRPPETEECSIDIPLRITYHKEKPMDTNNTRSNDKMDLEFVARIIGKDGSVIEKTIRLEDALPDLEDFDLSTKEGFLRDFDEYEKSVLSARNQIAEDITTEYLKEASKKNSSRNK